jgi:hypothetical protein
MRRLESVTRSGLGREPSGEQAPESACPFRSHQPSAGRFPRSVSAGSAAVVPAAPIVVAGTGTVVHGRPGGDVETAGADGEEQNGEGDYLTHVRLHKKFGIGIEPERTIFLNTPPVTSCGRDKHNGRDFAFSVSFKRAQEIGVSNL